MKICVYSCITGKYDLLHEPKIVPAGVDFICFSDQPIFSRVWMWRKLPETLCYLSAVKQQRLVKICPHKWLPEYDVSIWIDGNVLITGNILEFLNQYDLTKSPLYTRIHPVRNCIYAEAAACLEMKKASPEEIEVQISKYRNEGYPANVGMVETCILVRKHNDPKCIMLDNAWATELLNHSHRDQLSFNYVCWKMNFLPGYLTNEFGMTSNNFFTLKPHGQ